METRIKSYVSVANSLVIMPIIVHQLDNNPINPGLNHHSQQIIVRNHHKINRPILQIMDRQIITCQKLFVFVVMKKDISHQIVQTLVIMVRQKRVMLKLKVNKKVTIHHGIIKVRIKTQQNINRTLWLKIHPQNKQSKENPEHVLVVELKEDIQKTHRVKS